jgi:hypothetical protein
MDMLFIGAVSENWDLNSNLDVFGMQTFLRGLIYDR